MRRFDVKHAMTLPSRSLWGAIWLGGLVAGTVDIGSACVIYNATPFIILQAIARGVLGKSSFEQGWRSAILGLALQWGMSILIAACCVGSSARVTFFKRNWVAAGLTYGVITFFVMNYVVVPLSAIGKIQRMSAALFAENVLAMLLFALIITSIATRALGVTGESSGRRGSP